MKILVIFASLLFSASAMAEPIRFVAFGDMPYCQPGAPDRCPAEEGRVARLMAQINAARPAFSIFVGDTKGGAETCTDEKVLRAFSWMTLADHPLIYTPGDNEWVDCWQDRGGRFDPQERLALLRTRFFPDALSLGQRPMPLQRQAAPTVENARWSRDNVIFATIHIPGSNNGRPAEPGEEAMESLPHGATALAESTARDVANRAWLAETFAAVSPATRAIVLAVQADMFYRQTCGHGYGSGYRAFLADLAPLAARFGKPVLLINGDTHLFRHSRPLASAPNLMRLMVPGNRDVQAVVVTLDPEAAAPFDFELLGEAGRPPSAVPCPGYALPAGAG